MRKLTVVIFFLIIAGWGCQSSRKNLSKTNKTTFKFNKSWQFARGIDTTVVPDYFAKNRKVEWQDISLPHTAHIEPLVIKDQQWQGTAFYRKFFEISPADSNKHIAIKIGAAMHEADVYLNGEKLMKHKGGYLPFVVDISERVKFGRENALLIKLNNENNATIPPGKPIESLDFNYFSGMYRNAYLMIDDKLRISDPIEANRTAAGGLRIHYTNVSDKEATVNLQVDIANDHNAAQKANLITTLRDQRGKLVTQMKSKPTSVAPDSFALIDQSISISEPELWSPDHPYLYDLTVELRRNGKLIDSKTEEIGIRTFHFNDENQFVLNGEPLRLRGTNRHQSYPYIGYALSDNAQYRDAYKIKQAGFNFIRTAHYPPSPAFLEACDELGILFMDATPGWQFFGGEEFQNLAHQNIRNMIRRDRNHPSVVIWEASLNESNMDKPLMDKANRIVHEELPFEHVYSSGWMDYAYDIYIPARQHAKPPSYWNAYGKDKPLFIAEYGDWEYYAQNAGFNQESFEDLQEDERNSRQLRSDGQKRLAQQAVNFQEAHNSNLKGPAFGDANWLMYDYNRGYAPNIEASGIRDIFRIPKFSYYFYRSQAGPNTDTSARFGKPMVKIANFWTDPNFKDVKVYSNADDVELFLNGESVGRKRPDSGRISSELRHPPFTFNLENYEPGTLRAVAYIDGEKVAEDVQNTPGEASKLKLKVDFSGKKLEAGSKDVVFVYASIVDKNGNRIPTDTSSVTFSVEGDAEIIGKNPINAEAGIATVLLRAGERAGKIRLRAKSEGLRSVKETITISM